MKPDHLAMFKIGVSIVLASLLELLVFAQSWLGHYGFWFRPEWVALVVIYWGLYMPHRCGVFFAWCVGLWLDVLHGTLLGQQAAALAIQAYCTYVVYLRFRVFPVIYQSGVVMVLIGINLLVNRTLQGVVTGVTESWLYYLPILSSALLWPVVAWLLDSARGIKHRVQI